VSGLFAAPLASASAAEGGLATALLVALLLGLRHATDPDHLTAMSTLVLSERPSGGARAGLLGLAWGAGHAVTLCLFGLPVVLVGRELPERAVRAAELAVGLLIVGLAARLLVRWRRGYFHSHPHRHGELRHAHPHVHEHASAEVHPPEHDHAHRHGERLGRSPLAAFGIGLVHGVGGSAGAGVLVVAALGPAAGALALGLLAAGTTLSMALASLIFGQILLREAAVRRLERLVPVLGAASLAFGLWYALAATGLLGSGG
jgi:ABC-type nickel/cobalt efflux system permease component RcnA